MVGNHTKHHTTHERYQVGGACRAANDRVGLDFAGPEPDPILTTQTQTQINTSLI